MENPQALALLQSLFAQGSQAPQVEVPVEIAAASGRIDILAQLLASDKFKINDKFDGKTILHIACEYGHSNIVQWSIQEGAELLEPDLNGNQPIHIAVLHGHAAILIFLLQLGIGINSLNSKMQNLLHLAATTDLIAMANILLRIQVDVFHQDEDGNTALHLAIKHNQFPMAKFLINHNSPLILTNKEGQNIFGAIIAEDKDKFLDYLIETKGNHDLINGSTENDQSLLHLAVIHNSPLCCAVLCQNSQIDFNKRDEKGQSALHLCIAHERETLLQYLLSIEEVYVNASDKDGETALHKALRKISTLPLEDPSREKLISMAKDLIRFGADLHQRNSSQEKAFDLCADETLKEIVSSCRREYEQTTIVRQFHKNLVEAGNKKRKELRELHIGDIVEFHLSEEEIQKLQNGHGGFIKAMEGCLDRQGVVEGFDKDGDVIVLFETRKQFIFNPKSLEKTGSVFDPFKIKVGDLIRVESDGEKLKSIQESAGVYNEEMKHCLGKIGYVRSIDDDGTVCAKHGPKKWKWNPQNVRRLSEEEFQDLKISNQGNQNFAINDLVLIECNLSRAQRIQKENWESEMHSCLGKFGCVKKVKNQKLIHVKVLGGTLEFEPKLLTLIVPAKDTNEIEAPPEADVVVDQNQLLQILQSLISSAGAQGAISSNGEGEGSAGSSSSQSTAAASGLLQNLLVNLLQQGGGGGSGMLIPAASQEIVEAIEKGQVAILKQKLAEKTINVDQKINGKSLLEIACEKGKFSVVDWLIKEKCDTNVTDAQGNTPLHIAVINSHPSVLTPLVKGGLLMETVNKSGKTPLHCCANKKGSARILRVACDKSAIAINVQDQEGNTPLHLAVDAKCLDEAKVLVEKKALLNLSNNNGFTCLHALVKNNMHELLKFAYEKNPQAMKDAINLLASNGDETALHIAVSSGSTECVQELLKVENIDLNLADGKGHCALFYSLNLQSTVGEQIAEMLASRGADLNEKAMEICSDELKSKLKTAKDNSKQQQNETE